MRRLWPDPADPITPAEAYAGPSRPPAPGRPWVEVCMVASLDGSPVVGGRSATLSSPADHAVLLALRAAADVVLVGAGTVRTEQYGAPSNPELRIAVVSASGNVDPASALFASGAGLLVTTEEAPDHGIETIRAGRGRVDLTAALGALGERLGARFVDCEGGPTLNGALLDAGLVDGLNLTVSPVLVGGDGPRVVAGAAPQLERMELAQLCEDGGFTFLRYVRPA